MTETSTVTPFQELTKRLETGNPLKQVLVLLNRIEAIEKKMQSKKKVKGQDEKTVPQAVAKGKE